MELVNKTGWWPPSQRVAAVLWISFLMAAVATGAFFSVIDPMELRYCVSFPEVSRLGAYTIGFFLFWLLTGISCLLSIIFVYPAEPTKAPPFMNSSHHVDG
ncbi:MAG: hypothetical protein HY749_14145 [Gammaproteobacteria bacterium]|nr:hypothetical protein [Gammaproteobacteria bacterium]MBI5616289.1 hypothetical protein [Gammaproteobacteria bacterium]